MSVEDVLQRAPTQNSNTANSDQADLPAFTILNVAQLRTLLGALGVSLTRCFSKKLVPLHGFPLDIVCSSIVARPIEFSTEFVAMVLVVVVLSNLLVKELRCQTLETAMESGTDGRPQPTVCNTRESPHLARDVPLTRIACESYSI